MRVGLLLNVLIKKKKREKTFRGDSEAYGLVIIYGDSFMAEYVCLNILRCTHPTLQLFCISIIPQLIKTESNKNKQWVVRPYAALKAMVIKGHLILICRNDV